MRNRYKLTFAERRFLREDRKLMRKWADEDLERKHSSLLITTVLGDKVENAKAL